MAPSRSMALRSGILVSGISRTCAFVTLPALSVRGFAAPFSMPAAWRSRNGVGGVLVTNVNERSSKIEISAGITMPRWFSVAALYALQKSMMLMPCGPSAVPTGGAGVACPAGIWILTTAANRFFATACAPLSSRLQLRDLAELELDRGLTSEDVHKHLELRAVDVDLADRAVEVGERPGHHPHLLTGLELQPGTGLLLRHLGALDLPHAQDVLDL